MKTIQLNSEVGIDGVLSLRVPFGTEEAGQKVTVIIEPAEVTNKDYILKN